ncbi:MAG: ribokinase [Candidatus Marinimicrobia bacterium]|jgi:ribokinase|nr:ribokinase [Candidatus Neomarinimicrobiota bacterium]MBT3631141.1 ribokinase [Candidatus Neomarinimicrobiota bacterium]MBT3825039.1 ribokinase [Candidatus Neomarinimicrobiota bacterium]MBT4131382.1 ribokinase [Candidatus Neomarinimicrobiota bacterium]MBT4296861.1 ribokinase [Candidatus Neomarinimicrobiota bacterium]
MRSNKVIVVGSYNVDMTINVDVFPQAGETVIGNNLAYGHGGKGANQAVAACLAGAKTSLLAKVGSDLYGNRAIEALTLKGVNTRSIQKEKVQPTGMAFITVDSMGENTIVVVSGANWKLSPHDIESESKVFTDGDVLLTQLETPLDSVSAAIKMAQKTDVTVILNPAPAQTLPPDLLKDVDIITPNRAEAEMLTGIKITDEKSLLASAERLHSYGVKIVLITLGSKGVFMSHPEKSLLIPTIRVDVVDTVGAGDVFNGVLAAYYSNINSLEDVVARAIIAAGLSVTSSGAQTSIPTLDTIISYQLEHSEA